jgi:DNA-binding MarR family transcriptional regulator
VDIAEAMYALIVHVHKNCNSDLFEALGMLELTLTQIKLLHHLEEPDVELSIKELAELVALSLPAASRTVDDLVRRGFVERREDPEDRRMKRVRSTEDGRGANRRLNAARLSGLRKFTDSLSGAERDAVATALQILLERPEIKACLPEGLDA